MGDIQFAIEAAINGDFSWSNYLEHKKISIVCSLLTCGVGAYLNRGVQMSSAGAKKVIGKVFTKIAEAAGNALVGIGISKGMDMAFDQLRKIIFQKIEESATKSMSRLRAKLTTLSNSIGQDPSRLGSVLDEIENVYFDDQKLEAEITKHTKGVANAIAAGIGKAAKNARKHTGAFKSLSTAAQVASRSIDTAFVLKEVIMSLTQIEAFVSKAEAVVDTKVQLQAQETMPAVGSDAEISTLIDSKVKHWSELLSCKIKQRIQKGVVEPKVTAAAQNLLHNMGKMAMDKVKKSIGEQNFVDKKYEQSLRKVREHNLTRLANVQGMFKRSEAKEGLSEILSRETGTTFDLTQLDPQKKILDGYTVEDLRQHVPEVRVAKIGERYVVIPPGRLFEATKCVLVEHMFDKHDIRPENYKLEFAGEKGHASVVLHGKQIVLSNGEKKTCPEQVVLWWKKYNETKNEDTATRYALDQIEIALLRWEQVQECTNILMQNQQVAQFVSKCMVTIGDPSIKAMKSFGRGCSGIDTSDAVDARKAIESISEQSEFAEKYHTINQYDNAMLDLHTKVSEAMQQSDTSPTSKDEGKKFLELFDHRTMLSSRRGNDEAKGLSGNPMCVVFGPENLNQMRTYDSGKGNQLGFEAIHDGKGFPGGERVYTGKNDKLQTHVTIATRGAVADDMMLRGLQEIMPVSARGMPPGFDTRNKKQKTEVGNRHDEKIMKLSPEQKQQLPVRRCGNPLRAKDWHSTKFGNKDQSSQINNPDYESREHILTGIWGLD